MSYKDITAGDKTGKATAARFIKSGKKGTPGIEIKFEFEERATGTMESLNWVAWLSDKAKENSFDTLAVVLGCNGNEDVNGDGVFTDPNFLDFNREVKLVVELEAGQNEDGSPKTNEAGDVVYYPNIKWVNAIGGSAYARCTPEIVKKELAATGFRSGFLRAAKEAGTSIPAMKNSKPAPSLDYIPF